MTLRRTLATATRRRTRATRRTRTARLRRPPPPTLPPSDAASPTPLPDAERPATRDPGRADVRRPPAPPAHPPPAAVRRAPTGRAAVRPAGCARSAGVRRARLLPHAGSRRAQQGHGDHRPDPVDPRLHLHRCAGRDPPRDRRARPRQGRPQPRQGARHRRADHQRDQPDRRGDRRLLRLRLRQGLQGRRRASRPATASPPRASPTTPQTGVTQIRSVGCSDQARRRGAVHVEADRRRGGQLRRDARPWPSAPRR